MRVNLDGTPASNGLLNVSVGVAKTKEKGQNTLVFVDNDTGEQVHIPLRDEQMEAIYGEWFGKHVEVANESDMRALVGANGKPL